MAKFLYTVVRILLAIGFGLLHRWHVSTVFENDRHFSHLSEMEREMSFRTEMGMYYHYFKVIAESKNFDEGLVKIRNDNLSEYPNVIDAVKTYSLLPEIIIGRLYHMAKSLGLFPPKECWQVDRGKGLSSVQSCEGLIVPIYFYLECVWFCAALTGVFLFLFGTHLSGSIFGGFITITAFLMNHSEATRIQWTPPLRESFAYPILLFQMYKTTTYITNLQQNSHKRYLPTLIAIFFSTLLSLKCWQFSQFVFLIQLLALLILKWLKRISNNSYLLISMVHGLAVILISFETGNSFYYQSLYASLIVTSFIFSMTKKQVTNNTNKIYTVYEIIITLSVTQFTKKCFSTEDDVHIYNILKTKLFFYKDFHTLLYTCSPEFDFLKTDTFIRIIETLLLPTAILATFLTLYFYFRNTVTLRQKEPDEGGGKLLFWTQVEPDIAYNYLQTGAFTVMAVFIMRLKLFMTPHLCLIAGLASKKQYLAKIGLKSEITRQAFVILLVSAMVYRGLPHLKNERSVVGEYSNVEQEQLFEWIKANTMPNSAFAGKMSLMANIMLSTGRPIVNNPYYENKEMRDRTFKIYSTYSRENVTSIYETFKSLHVDYVVIDHRMCYSLVNHKLGCNILDFYDVADGGEAILSGRLPTCPLLFQGNPHPFKRVFANRNYAVLSITPERVTIYQNINNNVGY